VSAATIGKGPAQPPPPHPSVRPQEAQSDEYGRGSPQVRCSNPPEARLVSVPPAAVFGPADGAAASRLSST